MMAMFVLKGVLYALIVYYRGVNCSDIGLNNKEWKADAA